MLCPILKIIIVLHVEKRSHVIVSYCVILVLILAYEPFICKYCGKGFARSDHLNSHHHIHTGERPYMCKDCGKGFAQSSGLINHSRIHTGDKHFICKDCGKGFITSNKLTRHSHIHTGEKLFI